MWGATSCFSSISNFTFYFNPRSPCGERLVECRCIFGVEQFQSTLPVWGATQPTFIKLKLFFISIHAPRVGSDYPEKIVVSNYQLFQSTLPVWGATANRNKKSLVSILNNIILYKIKQGAFLFLGKILLLICDLPSFFGANLPRIL